MIVYLNDYLPELTAVKFKCHLIGGKRVHQSLWDSFDDITTEFIYRMILVRVRSGVSVRFNFSCGDADYSRLFEAHICLQNNGEVVFEARNLSENSGSPPNELEKISTRTNEKLLVCSWCERLRITDDDWQSVDEGINTLRLFESQNLPKISHGICSKCYRTIFSKISGG